MTSDLKTLTKLIIGLLMLFLVQACKDQRSAIAEREKTSADIESEVRKEIEDLYEVYTKSDLQWVDFYKDEYTLASDDGRVYTKYADSLRIEWKDIYSRYDVILRKHGAPVITAAGDQVFHYNSFDEIFIEKVTKDTIENIGTWVVLWKRQEDDSWKIEFETYHAK